MEDKNAAIPQPWGVHISFHYIRYREGSEKIEFGVEPLVGEPSVISIPSVDRWQTEMPEWAKGRRDEILTRLKDETKHLEWTWEEY